MWEKGIRYYFQKNVDNFMPLVYVDCRHSTKWKMKKTSTWVFVFQKYGKFWSVSLELFIKQKPLISENCVAMKYVILWKYQRLKKTSNQTFWKYYWQIIGTYIFIHADFWIDKLWWKSWPYNYIIKISEFSGSRKLGSEIDLQQSSHS